MSSISLSELKELAKKYSVSATGSKATIAQTLTNLRGRYLTKAEIEKIKPLLKKQNKNKKILLKVHYPVAKKKASLKARMARKARLVKKRKLMKK
jgi:hypothetical protein